jgi:hypothetical protein
VKFEQLEQVLQFQTSVKGINFLLWPLSTCLLNSLLFVSEQKLQP